MLHDRNPVTGHGQAVAVVELRNALDRGFGQLKVDEGVSLGFAVCVAVRHGRRDVAAAQTATAAASCSSVTSSLMFLNTTVANHLPACLFSAGT